MEAGKGVSFLARACQKKTQEHWGDYVMQSREKERMLIALQRARYLAGDL
jgi:hypothetical protein